jgi:Major Vault Protein repeat domain
VLWCVPHRSGVHILTWHVYSTAGLVLALDVAYLPLVTEKVIKILSAHVMTEDVGAHMISLSEFVDQFGHRREPGDQWLITRQDTEEFIPEVQGTRKSPSQTTLSYTHIHTVGNPAFRAVFYFFSLLFPHHLLTRCMCDMLSLSLSASLVFLSFPAGLIFSLPTSLRFLPLPEKVTTFISLTVLSDRQYCVIENPVVDGRSQMGARVTLRGERRFFLRPGEKIVGGIQLVRVLEQDYGLQVRALQSFSDESGSKPVQRRAGDRWHVWGPREYWPPLEVQLVRAVRFHRYFGRMVILPLVALLAAYFCMLVLGMFGVKLPLLSSAAPFIAVAFVLYAVRIFFYG